MENFLTIRKVLLSLLIAASLSTSFYSQETGAVNAALTGTTRFDANTPQANGIVAVAANGALTPGQVCTGTLISSDIVMTAAHCFRGSEETPPLPTVSRYMVTPSTSDWQNPSKWYPFHVLQNVQIGFGNDLNNLIKSVRATHYMKAGYADIILLKLESPVANSVAQPVPILTKLPSRAVPEPFEFWKSQNFRLVGWGRTNGNAITSRRLTTNTNTAIFWPGPGFDVDCPQQPGRPGDFNRSYITPSSWQGATSCGCFPNKMCVGTRSLSGGGDSGGPLLWTDPGSGTTFNIGVLQGVRPGVDEFTITFGEGGRASNGDLGPNIGNWLEKALNRDFGTYWIDQTGTGRNESGDRFGSAFTVGDFIVDPEFNKPDLAVGAPGENFEGSGPNAGVVFLFRLQGSKYTNYQVISQAGVDSNESGDRFGAALATGDFNGDGLDDLVVGAPGEDFNGSGSNSGMVFLYNGNGSSVENPVLIGQNPVDRHERGDLFGSALAVGDLNADGYLDLVVGAPGETFGTSNAKSGVIFYFSGSSTGLNDPIIISQSGIDIDENGDRFGTSLEIADFDSDGIEDLAVGAPGENFSAGVVYVFKGGPTGPRAIKIIDQWPAGRNESGDEFGTSLASGDINADGEIDLCIGVPGENYEGSGANSGVVFINYGSPSGLGDLIVFGQNPSGRNETGDRFGSSLAIGDYNGDDFDDLAIGTPGENYEGSGPGAGLVYIASGIKTGINPPIYYEQKPAGRNEEGDNFGAAMISIQTGSFSDGLVIGAPGENITGSGRNSGVFFHMN